MVQRDAPLEVVVAQGPRAELDAPLLRKDKRACKVVRLHRYHTEQSTRDVRGLSRFRTSHIPHIMYSMSL